MSLNPDLAPAGFYSQAGATAYLIDPAGAYSPAGTSAPTTDPAGTDDGGIDDGVGASAPTLAAAGVYIPITGATSAAAEIVDPEGDYSLAGAGTSAPPTDPAGTDGGAGASAPTLAAAGAYIPITEASSAAEIVEPEGTYSLAGASAPTLAAAGAYIPITEASSAAEIVEPEGTYSLAGASAPTTDPAGRRSAAGAPRLAAPGAHIPETGPTAAAAAQIRSSPPGTYLPPGHSAPIDDPGGTYSGWNASAATTDPAGTYSSPYALNRLFLEWENIVPSGTALAFTNETEVANYFGVGSVEDDEAKTFFAGYENTDATMYFTRDPIGQRPHLLGANLAGDTLSELRAIHGSLALTFDGFNYQANIDLSGVTSLDDAAKAIQAALNKHRQTGAVVTGSITSHTVTFIGSIYSAQLTVDKIISGGPIVVGGIVDGAGITKPGTNTQIIHDHGADGGPGHYSTYHSNHGNVPKEQMTETYGVLTINSVISGTVALGEQVSGAGVTGLAPATGIDTNLSGSGVGSQWIVNNAPTVGAEQMTLKAPLIGVYEDRSGQPIIGKTENNAFFDVSVQGEFGFDQNPSTISYMSGTAADALGLSEAGGALPPSAGGEHMSAAHMMNLMKTMLDQNGNLIHFGSVFSNNTSFDTKLAAWADSPAGLGYELLTSNTAAGSDAPVSDPPGTHSGPGASKPTWGAEANRAYVDWGNRGMEQWDLSRT